MIDKDKKLRLFNRFLKDRRIYHYYYRELYNYRCNDSGGCDGFLNNCNSLYLILNAFPWSHTDYNYWEKIHNKWRKYLNDEKAR